MHLGVTRSHRTAGSLWFGLRRSRTVHCKIIAPPRSVIIMWCYGISRHIERPQGANPMQPVLGIPLPSLDQLLLDAEVVQHPRHHEIHHIRYLLRPVIKTR